MIILGIDPGTATTGYGLIQADSEKVEVIDFGLIETSKELMPAVRLSYIHRDLIKLLARHTPDVLVIESVFFATNAKTAIRVGQAQGVMLLSAAQSNIPVIEYAPGTIKKLISGSGRADKKMMQKSVRDYLGPRVRSRKKKKTHFDNAADALAVALCHVFHLNGSLSVEHKHETG